MPSSSLLKRWIIGACLLGAALLAGCNMALKLGYNQGPTLLYWWADAYADFHGGAQATRVKQLIELWFTWHRRERLPDYAQLLERAQTQVQQPVLTPQVFCGFADELRQRLRTDYDKAVPSIAEAMLTLTPEQLEHVQKKFDKNHRKFRDAFLDPKREDRLKAQAKKVEERLKMVYGSVTDAQHRKLMELLAASPYDPELWLAERRQLQHDALQQLRALQHASAAQPGNPQAMQQAQALLRSIGQQAEQSPRAAYREQQQKVIAYNCLLTAEMHNSMSPTQRQAAVQKIGRWHEDVLALQRQLP
jgi:hypothetical protein